MSSFIALMEVIKSENHSCLVLFETDILMECYQQLIEALILPRVGPIAQMANISFSSLASNILHWLAKAAIR